MKPFSAVCTRIIRVTVFGEVTLTDGVDELIRGEQAFEAMYGSLTGR